MSERHSTRSTGGIGFFGLLTVLFIGLKLTGYITWSWFWVLSPLLIPLAIFLVIAAFTLVLAAVLTSKPRRRGVPNGR